MPSSGSSSTYSSSWFSRTASRRRGLPSTPRGSSARVRTTSARARSRAAARSRRSARTSTLRMPTRSTSRSSMPSRGASEDHRLRTSIPPSRATVRRSRALAGSRRGERLGRGFREDRRVVADHDERVTDLEIASRFLRSGRGDAGQLAEAPGAVRDAANEPLHVRIRGSFAGRKTEIAKADEHAVHAVDREEIFSRLEALPVLELDHAQALLVAAPQIVGDVRETPSAGPGCRAEASFAGGAEDHLAGDLR